MSDLNNGEPQQAVQPQQANQSIPGAAHMGNIGGPFSLLPLMMPSFNSGAISTSSTESIASGSPNLMPPPSAAAPIRRRRFSTARIQPTRIKKVMQADEEIGRMVQSVPVAIGRAMEHFAEKFLQATAQATLATNNRTLTPSHMKQAMLNNPHFYFLEPLFRDIAVPGKVGMGLESPTDMVPPQGLSSPLVQSPATPLTPGQFPFVMPSTAMYHPLLASTLAQQMNIQAGMPSQVPPSKSDSATVSSPTAAAIEPKKSYKRSNSGPADAADVPTEKPKRGRPRKIKKDEKCLDDDLCKEVTSNIEKEDKDRELMPPPALPVGLNLGRAKPFA